MMTRRAFALGALAQLRTKPNILLIVTDDQGWWDLGIHGNSVIETPALDKLGAASVRFNRFYVSPVCAPTRASLMTGRHYLRTGVYNTRFGGDTMHAGEITIAEVLKKAGYKTALFGKWHLGRYAKYHPLRRGFGEALTFSQGHLERYTHPDQLNWNRTPVEARGHISDVIADSARSYLLANRGRPYFCYVAFNAPHTPLYAPDAYAERYLKKGLSYSDAHMYGMVSHMDAAIGRLLEAVDDNTIVLFMSDNGGVSKHFTAGLRGFKASAFEGGVRSPLFVRGQNFRPRTVNAVTAHIDIFPTLCELAGAEIPRDRKIDGVSFAKHLRGEVPADPNRRVFHIWDRFAPSLRSNALGIGGQRYKWVRGQLFDLENDPAEKVDISAKEPTIAAGLRKELEEWFADVTKGQVFEPVPIEVGRDDENPVEVQASWAAISEGATYTFLGYDWDSVEKLGVAKWKLDVVRPGLYDVRVSYALAAEAGDAAIAIRIGGAEVTARIAPSAGPNVFAVATMGRARLPKGPCVMEARATKPEVAINRIWLQRT